jgi:hypothetical protein
LLTESYTLYAQSTGFFGVVEQAGLLDSFSLLPSTINHGNLDIENLSYTGQTVPVRPTTWGRVKTRYGNP